MADGNQFVPTSEENLMLADDRTAAHSMDANLVFIPLGAFGMAVEFIVRLLSSPEIASASISAVPLGASIF